MNLELLDPFGNRQIPDRIDATLSLNCLNSNTNNNNNSNSNSNTTNNNSAAQHVAFPRRGPWVAIGYGNGSVAILHMLTRSVVAWYPNTNSNFPLWDCRTKKKEKSNEGTKDSESGDDNDDNDSDFLDATKPNGITSVSWSRRSRTLLTGAAGETGVEWVDVTHPYGRMQCAHQWAIHNNNNAQDAGNTAAAADQQGNTTGMVDGNATNLPDAFNHIQNSNKNMNNTAAPEWHRQRDANQRICLLPRRPASPFLEEEPYDYKNGDNDNNNDNNNVTLIQDTIRWPTEWIVPSTAKDKNDTTTDADAASSSPSAAFHNTNTIRYRAPCVTFALPQPLSGSLQVHPRHATCGLATLLDGTLLFLWMPTDIFTANSMPLAAAANESDDDDDAEPTSCDDDNAPTANPGKQVTLIPLLQSQEKSEDENAEHHVTCATFDPRGDFLYAVTKPGDLLVVDLRPLLDELSTSQKTTSSIKSPPAPPPVRVIPGVCPSGAACWHCLVSRNGQFLLLNGADRCIRLFQTADLMMKQTTEKDAASSKPQQPPSPIHTFQDVVSKVRFASVDWSGDAEYVVAGTNADDNQYELYVWSTDSGQLVDKLTGMAGVSLYSVAWHPTRNWIAVATSDGLVDVWGTPVNWTHFAPDFQALPQNVVYVEAEDEFDQTADGQYHTNAGKKSNTTEESTAEAADVNVTQIEAVPVFAASDSEDEEDVFQMEAVVFRGQYYQQGGRNGGTTGANNHSSSMAHHHQSLHNSSLHSHGSFSPATGRTKPSRYS